MLVTSAIGILPLIYVVHKKKNLYIGIIAHILINSIDLISAFALLFAVTI